MKDLDYCKQSVHGKHNTNNAIPRPKPWEAPETTSLWSLFHRHAVGVLAVKRSLATMTHLRRPKRNKGKPAANKKDTLIPGYPASTGPCTPVI